MIADLQNKAWIGSEVSGGFAQLHTSIWTRISNAKRQRLLIELSLRQFEALEQIVKEMPYEDVEKSLVHLAPIKGSNGDGAGQDKAYEAIESSGGETIELEERHKQ